MDNMTLDELLMPDLPLAKRRSPSPSPAAGSSLSSGKINPGRSTTGAGNAGPKCFRISNVPSDWNEDMLFAALETIDPFLDRLNLQLSLYPACCGASQTALLNLGVCTEYFLQLLSGSSNHISIPGKVVLVIDSEFYDLTPLNSPGDEVVAELVLSCLDLPRSC